MPNKEHLKILKKGVPEWNSWREEYPDVRPDLRGADLYEWKLPRADLRSTDLRGADLNKADLQGADLRKADLRGTMLIMSNLCGVDLQGADLRWANFMAAIVDGGTIIWGSSFDQDTDFIGVGLDSAIIDPGMKEALKWIIRKKQWLNWYSEPKYLKIPKQWSVGLFWWISDYGRSTFKILLCFFISSICFAGFYFLIGFLDISVYQVLIDEKLITKEEYIKMVNKDFGIIANLFFVKGEFLDTQIAMVRSAYFAIVTMTTLGFGDIYANSGYYSGHIILMVQVLFGYVMLGALITRFAVMFSGGGPQLKDLPKRKTTKYRKYRVSPNLERIVKNLSEKKRAKNGWSPALEKHLQDLLKRKTIKYRFRRALKKKIQRFKFRRRTRGVV